MIRKTATWMHECSCSAPEVLFGPWEKCPQDVRDQIPDNGLPCDEGGVPGPWCRDCKFGRVEEFCE